MMRTDAGKYDRLIQFERRVVSQDGLGAVEEWVSFGPPRWSHVREMGATEVAGADQVENSLKVRFIVRFDDFTAEITPVDRISYGGMIYTITAKRELPDRRLAELEFVGTARADL
jgi:head-tail adaptor